LVTARRWQSSHIWPTTGAVGGRAHGVQLEGPAGNAQLVEQGGQHFQYFGIAQRRLAACRGRSNDFCADLEELPVAALLRALAAELRADVVELLQLAGFAQLVLDVGPDHASGVFRAQGERLGG
jgi:hypothetical protein